MSLYTSNESAIRWQAGFYFLVVFALCNSVWNLITEVNNLLYFDNDNAEEVESACRHVTLPRYIILAPGLPVFALFLIETCLAEKQQI